MSDGANAQSLGISASQAGRAAQRAARLSNLENLLSNIARHLQSSGDRHADVVAQLQDRLRYLTQSTSATAQSSDIDRHLALFEAQLTSLAIRTGVPTQSLPQVPVPQTAPAPMPHPAAPTPFADAADQRAAPMATQASVQQHAQPAPAPVPPAPQPHPSTSPPAQAPAIQQLAPEEAMPASPALSHEAIGAPPPSRPTSNLPGLNVLKRQSNQSFEDAVAADRAELASTLGSTSRSPEEQHIFAYHPPTAGPNDRANVIQPLAGTNRAAVLPVADTPPTIALDIDKRDTTADATPSTNGMDHQNSGSELSDAAAVPTFDAPDAEFHSTSPTIEAAETATSMDALRSDLETAMNGARADQKPMDPTTPPEMDVPSPMVAIMPEDFDDAPNADIAPPSDLQREIAELAKRLDSVTASVEQIGSGLEETRAEVPKLIEQAAVAAANKATAQFQSSEETIQQRMNELQGRMDEQRPGALPNPAAAPHSRAQQAVQPETPIDIARVDEHAESEGRLAQAKGSMLRKLAPMSNLMSRRARNVEAEAVVPTPEVAPALATPEHGTVEPSTTAEQSLQSEPQDFPLELETPQERLADQSISSLRKSLFQNLKDGAPPALVIVFAVITLLSGSLIWTLTSGDGAKEEQRIASAGIAKQSADALNADGLEITNSTSRLPASSVDGLSTAGSLAPTSSTGKTSNDNAPPVKPAALKPLTGGLSRTASTTSGSKLDLPPLTTGPLSLRVAAADGDPAAQFEVASRLAQGNGVARDPIAAVKWYTRAASAGHARAQYRLAALYERGAGVATDTGRAKIWYTRAAQQGNVKAMHNLAVLYAGQAAGAPNYVSAAQWFERAAEHGLADSQFNVAILYLNGLGVTKSLPDAYKWFALAGKEGDQEAVRRLKGVEAQLTPSQLRTAKNTVKNWRAQPALEAANKVVNWQPKSATKAPVPVAKIRKVAPAPKVAANTGPLGPTDVKKIQRLLNGLGFDAGIPDGKVGGKTLTSIKSFQARNGMVPTGKVDRALIGRIEGVMRERAARLGKI